MPCLGVLVLCTNLAMQFKYSGIGFQLNPCLFHLKFSDGVLFLTFPACKGVLSKLSRKVVKRCQRIKTMPLKVRVQKHQIARRIIAWPSNSFVLSYLKKESKKNPITLCTGILLVSLACLHLSYGFRCAALIFM